MQRKEQAVRKKTKEILKEIKKEQPIRNWKKTRLNLKEDLALTKRKKAWLLELGIRRANFERKRKRTFSKKLEDD